MVNAMQARVRFSVRLLVLAVLVGSGLVAAASAARAQGATSFSISDGVYIGGQTSEGSGGGTTVMQFTVTITGTRAGASVSSRAREIPAGPEKATGAPISGTCGGEADFVLRNDGPFSWSATDAASKTFLITTCADDRDEENERFEVELFNPGTAALTRAVGQATILDDDDPPTIVVGNIGPIEGNAGSVARTFPVNLSRASGKIVTFNYSTTAGTARGDGACGVGPANNPTDYVTVTNAARTISAGATTPSVPVTVQVCGDTFDEPNQTFSVSLATVVNATVVGGAGQATINDDDLPTLTWAPGLITPEGNTTKLNSMVFTARLSSASTAAVTFTLTVATGGASVGPNCATAPSIGPDFLAPASPVTIQSGNTSTPIPVSICGDTIAENDEAFALTIGNVAGAIPGPNLSVGGTIANDDGATGSHELSPQDATVEPVGRVTLDLSWTVPEPDVWRSLESIDVRLRDERGTAIWVRWDEQPNTFRLVDSGSRLFSPSGGPGSNVALTGSAATLNLRDARVVTSGPTGRVVTLGLPIELSPNATGRSFAVEASAKRDGAGGGDPFTRSGTLRVAAPAGSELWSASSRCGAPVMVPALGSATVVNVSASSADEGEQLTLTASSLPSFAKFTSTPGNPATGQLTLAPSVLDWVFAPFAAPAEATLIATGAGTPPVTSTCSIPIRLNLFG